MENIENLKALKVKNTLAEGLTISLTNDFEENFLLMEHEVGNFRVCSSPKAKRAQNEKKEILYSYAMLYEINLQLEHWIESSHWDEDWNRYEAAAVKHYNVDVAKIDDLNTLLVSMWDNSVLYTSSMNSVFHQCKLLFDRYVMDSALSGFTRGILDYTKADKPLPF